MKKTLKSPAALARALVSKDKFNSAWFTTTLTFVLKSIIQIMRKIRGKDDGWNGFAGCVLGGYLSMFILKSDKKMFFANLMLSRGIECIYNSMADKGYY